MRITVGSSVTKEGRRSRCCQWLCKLSLFSGLFGGNSDSGKSGSWHTISESDIGAAPCELKRNLVPFILGTAEAPSEKRNQSMTDYAFRRRERRVAALVGRKNVISQTTVPTLYEGTESEEAVSRRS